MTGHHVKNHKMKEKTFSRPIKVVTLRRSCKPRV